jgi:hypothetical protein
MSDTWTSVPGVLRAGFGVASGASADYPYGALDRQIPIFASRGLDLSSYFRGTLNIDIRPFVFQIVQPEYCFRDVRWTDLHPAEHFSFAHCMVVHRAVTYDGWIYYPHPETKERHHQSPSIIEVIAHRIPGLETGRQLEVRVDPQRVALVRQPPPAGYNKGPSGRRVS